ncbi:DNA damage-regulated autophagy modulator protein 2-like [Dermatophagoides pteronyssinus]|uniref:DNA damage-regulated autophagy modulator protein 2 n=1 Tax=Dermatophagoides pteronyssinus TaxID=6956 RepID=A0ABQ8JL78_DERPT|nr:DNA damage-regulated autophagy modulator protein 2 [Dermatophagoides pteronyssinus]
MTEIKQKFYMFVKANLRLFPLMIAILLPILIWLPYLLNNMIDDNGEHDFRLIPFHGDTSNGSPSSNIFSTLFDFISVLIIITAWIRYKQVKTCLKELNILHNNHIHNERLRNFNFFSLSLALMVATGGCLMGNFSFNENTLTFYVHTIGGFLFFHALLWYMLIQTYLAWILNQDPHSKESVPISMIITTGIGFASIILFSIFSIIVSLISTNIDTIQNIHERYYQSANDKHYYWYNQISAISEWIYLHSLIPFYLCLWRRIGHFKNDWNQISF